MKDWRDPNMTVTIDIRRWDGSTQSKEFSPEDVSQASYIHMLRQDVQHWSVDPTYNLRRPRRPKC